MTVLADTEVNGIIEARLGRRVVDATQIHSGNSQVFKLECADGSQVMAKIYPPADRDRLGVEFNALSFLHHHGVGVVPMALAKAPEARIAIYQYLEGERPQPASLAIFDLEQMLEFLGTLDRLRGEPDSSSLPAASEACFSFESYLGGVRQRLLRFAQVVDTTPLHSRARAFADSRLAPFFHHIEGHCAASLGRLGWHGEEEIPLAHRTLSPSDFGFHNTLRLVNGLLGFVDFEYFGWDDPAKLIADFLHHPAMPVAADLKRRFLRGALTLYQRDPALPDRLDLVYPLLGLKWCLIMLNEFLPEGLTRRKLANASLDVDLALATQLGKAERQLEQVQAFMEAPTLTAGAL